MENPTRSLISRFKTEITESDVGSNGIINQDSMYYYFADRVIEMCIDRGKTQGEPLDYLRDLLYWR
jgi:hypothetical protein